MANKRMFSKDVTASDAFLDMPSSSQVLYFHLGMEADDDGFVANPKKVARVVGAADDDLKILISKRFVLVFPSGVMVIKHHRINNNWDKHNCKRTMYLEEFSQLRIKENRAYTLDELQGIPLQSDFSLKTVSRIEENRIEYTSSAKPLRLVKDIEEEKPKKAPKYPHSKEVFGWFSHSEPSWARNTTELEHSEMLYSRGEETVRKALRYVAVHKEDEHFYQITKPSDLERKWLDIAEYARKN